jgi:hypothetical protein
MIVLTYTNVLTSCPLCFLVTVVANKFNNHIC